MIRPRCFNFYLLAGLCAALLTGGCAVAGNKGKRQQAAIRFHLELSAAERIQSTNVFVGRSSPFRVNVDRQFFLSELHVERAGVVEGADGFSVALQFNADGTHLLEQYTTLYRGRRVGILAEFGGVRWIAAPIMRTRVSHGQFVFTPDMTREEAGRLASGLNRVAYLVRKGRR